MRTISPFEFVRRFHHGLINHDGRYVWFLGAGCSVSAGIGDAGATTLRWLGELKYLETGTAEDVAAWAPDRFAGYDPTDPAALYGEVLDALFYTEQEQERELERINAQAEPGFGYATLAQLVTQPSWGERCNTIVTTNFDDLAADAFYLYSQRKPQVLTHESFDRRIRISTSRPTILKIYGDAHLGGGRGAEQGRLLRSDVKDRLRAQFTEAALVFIGYGGRDESVIDLLAGLPRGAPAGGIYWVNDREPGGALRDWLEERNTLWTPYGDFEGLMYLLRREFALGHPRIDRFDQILRQYDAQYRDLAARDDLKPDTMPGFRAPTPPRAPLPPAEPAPILAPLVPEAETVADDGETWEYSLAGTVADSFDSSDVIAEEDMHAYGEDTILSSPVPGPALDEADDADEDGDDDESNNRIDRLIAAAVAAMANGQRTDHATAAGVLTETLMPEAEPDRPVLSLVPGEAEDDIEDAPALADTDGMVEKHLLQADAQGDDDEDATPPAPATVDTLSAIDPHEGDDALELPRRLLSRADAAELDRRYLAAIQDAPGNSRLLARYARFLTVGRRDHDGAEHYFNRAIDANPTDGIALREFAKFLTDTRRDFDRAEECYRLALRVDFENTETLIAYATFLWRAAETGHRLDHHRPGACLAPRPVRGRKAR